MKPKRRKPTDKERRTPTCKGGDCPGYMGGKRTFGDPFRCPSCWEKWCAINAAMKGGRRG